MREIMLDVHGPDMVGISYAAKAMPEVRLSARGPSCIVEWWTTEGIRLQSHPMSESDAEAMASILDADTEISIAP